MPFEMNNVSIVMIPVNEIIPYWRNPRHNDKTVDALVETIPEMGFNVPIVIDKNNVVVKGHARLRAAKRLGMEKVPCIVSNAPEDVIKADRIADNKIQELSTWEFGKLNLEMQQHKMPLFEKLFNPKENPVSEADAEDISSVEFKPAGLQFLDGEYTEQEGSEASRSFEAGDYERHSTIPVSHEVYGETADRVEVPVGSPEVPQKKTLKTLCPYCGKVVIINV